MNHRILPRITITVVLSALVTLFAACSSGPTRQPSPSPIHSCSALGCGANADACTGVTTARLPLRPLPPVVAGTAVDLLRGDYRFSDFRVEPGIQRIGVLIPDSVRRFSGAGPAATILAMTPRTSTGASTIPAHFPDSNRLDLLRASGRTVQLAGFSVEGSAQGHPYNGLRVDHSVGARVTDVCVMGIPGTDRQPPGETFGISDNLTSGSVYRHIAVDGQGVSAAGLGVSVSSDVTVIDSRFSDNRFSAGATFWEVRDVHLRSVSSTGNGTAGLNFERVSGTVHIDAATFGRNGGGDIRIASDQGSAHFIITDPVTARGGRLTVVLPPTYYGHPNLQQRSAIRLLVDGKDRTADLVDFRAG